MDSRCNCTTLSNFVLGATYEFYYAYLLYVHILGYLKWETFLCSAWVQYSSTL